MASQPFSQRVLETYKVKSCGKRTTYLVDLKTLRDMNAQRWSRQRPADEERIEMIREWIEKEQDVSGILSMAWHPRENLIVYDGQHRWRALLKMDGTLKVFVEVMWDATEEEIVASFQSINRSVSVPELYTDPGVTEESTRTEIADFVTRIVATYKDFCSPKDKPHRPHFNRDRLTDDLLTIWRDDFDKEVPFGLLSKALLAMNLDYHLDMKSVPREASRKTKSIYDKCEKYHFWLFAQNGKINVDHLRATLEKYRDS